MSNRFSALALALCTIPLSSCVTVEAAQNVESYAQPEGTPVALGQPVYAGALVVTPAEVLEDSRCPANVQCVWAGRLVVETRIDGPGWLERVQLTLGEPQVIRGHTLTLTSAAPVKLGEGEIQPGEYRFTYSG